MTRLRLGTKKLPFPKPVYTVDSSMNKNGEITHYCNLLVKQGQKKLRQRFYVTNIGKDDFILGYPWFQGFNPDVDWANNQLKGPQVKVETIRHNIMEQAKKWIKETCEQAEILWIATETPQSGVTPVGIQEGPVEVKRTNTAIEMAYRYTEEHGKQEVTLPEEFKRHTAIFSDEEAKSFPPGRGEGDHKIELLETTPTSFNCKVYPLSKAEQEAEDKFLDENLAKGYIVPSNSPYRFSTFMVPKKDSKEKRYIINYRPLNAVTRKDVTPLPNLAQCIEDLQGMEIFSKFDIQWGYNNIQIHEGDEWKGIFKT